MAFLTKFVSRRLVVLGSIFVCPIVYHSFGITEQVTMVVVGAASAYILGRAYSDKKNGAG